MKVQPTALNGLYLIDLDVYEDNRGSFREAWKKGPLVELGLPALVPLQYNVSESKHGVIRGIHADPWDKYIHVAYGEIFAAIVDLRRDQPSFGLVETFHLSTRQALFVPQGLGNSFQALSEHVVYTYLVTSEWQANNPYPAVAYDDPQLAIPWPLPKSEWIISEKDQHNPTFQEAFNS